MTDPKQQARVAKLKKAALKRRRARADMSKPSTRPPDVSKQQENIDT